jgi:hypothetical protein
MSDGSDAVGLGPEGRVRTGYRGGRIGAHGRRAIGAARCGAGG